MVTMVNLIHFQTHRYGKIDVFFTLNVFDNSARKKKLCGCENNNCKQAKHLPCTIFCCCSVSNNDCASDYFINEYLSQH